MTRRCLRWSKQLRVAEVTWLPIGITLSNVTPRFHPEIESSMTVPFSSCALVWCGHSQLLTNQMSCILSGILFEGIEIFHLLMASMQFR
jgi:hypothetical protein